MRAGRPTTSPTSEDRATYALASRCVTKRGWNFFPLSSEATREDGGTEVARRTAARRLRGAALPPLPGRTTGCVTGVPLFNAVTLATKKGVKMPVICCEPKRLINVSKLLHCAVQKENCSIETCSATRISLFLIAPHFLKQ